MFALTAEAAVALILGATVASAVPQAEPLEINDVEYAAEAAAAVAAHVIVTDETAVGAPVDALIELIETVCVQIGRAHV